MRFQPLILVGCALMAAAAPAYGREVSLEVDQAIEVDSNVFRSTNDPTTDGIYTLKFVGRAREESERLSYDVRYMPKFQTYFKTSGLNGWDQVLLSDAKYQFSPQDVVIAKFDLQNYQTIRGDTVFDAAGQPEIVQDNDGRTQRIDARLIYRRSFGQRATADIAADFQQWTYTDLTSVDNLAVGGAASFQYAFWQRLSLGVSFIGRYRVFDEQLSLPGSNATTLNPNLTASLEITPTVSLQLSGGPSVFITQQETPTSLTVSRWQARIGPNGQILGRVLSPSLCISPGTAPFSALVLCPQADASTALRDRFEETVTRTFVAGQSFNGERSSDTTYFLNAQLSKRFARSSMAVTYRRSEDAASGQGSLTVLDAVDAHVRWFASDVWEVLVTGLWTHRQGVSNLEQAIAQRQTNTDGIQSEGLVDLEEAGLLWVTNARNETDLTQWQAALRLTRKFSKHIKVHGDFRYYRQGETALVGSGSADLENYTGLVTFSYSFDAFRF